MKKFKVFLTVIGIVFLGASLNLERIYDGLKVGRQYTKNILANELKTLSGIDTTKTISVQFSEKLTASDTTDMLAVYARTQRMLDSIVNLRNSIVLKADSIYLSNLSENVQQALNIRLDSLLSDAKYVAKGDSASLYDYVFSKIQSDSVSENRIFNYWKYNGFPKMLSLPMLSYTAWGRSLTMTDGSLYVTLHKMTKDTVLTNLNIFTFVTGNYTGDNYNGMLVYTTNSTGVTEVARTTNDTEIWKTAGSTKITKTLSTPITVTKGQIIGIGAIYNSSAQTAAPQLPSMGAIGANLFYHIPATTYRVAAVKTGVADPASSYTWGDLAVGTQLIGIWPE